MALLEEQTKKDLWGCFHLSVSLQWDLVCDHKKLNQAPATYFFLGVMVGAVVFGQLSDQ